MSKILVRPQFFRVLARIASVIKNAAFAVILFAIMAKEDKPQEAATPTIYLLLLAMISSLSPGIGKKRG